MATDPIDPNNLYLAVGMYTNGQLLRYSPV